MRQRPAMTRKDKQWRRTRFAYGTTRTPRLLPTSTPRRFPAARWAASIVRPVTLKADVDAKADESAFRGKADIPRRAPRRPL
jgi:hypothetical protein